MTKIKKPRRPKARLPRGFEDKSSFELRTEQRLISAAIEVYDRYGFEPLQTPAFEYADALGKFLPDEDRPNTGVFAMRDDDDQWMALRYDLTAPLARYVAQNTNTLNFPFRRYQVGSVWRNEKPGPGRFREFIQCDADSVKAPGSQADAEIIMMAADVMKQTGLTTGEYIVRINNRKLLDGILETCGIPNTDEGAEQRLRVLRAVDKLDRLGPDGVAALLGEGREDNSGDYTEGAKLDAASIKAVFGFTTASTEDRIETLDNLAKLVGTSTYGQEAIQELKLIDDILSRCGFGPDRTLFDTSIVRGLGYYTGPVFEAEFLADIRDKKNRPVRIGSVGGGGRYDDLVARFTGTKVPATGFSFGVSRFAAGLARLNRLEAEQDDLVVMCVFDQHLIGEYFQIVKELQAAGIRAEVFTGKANIGKQLKYADRRGARAAILMGADEKERGEVTIKDLVLGAKMAEAIENNTEWRESRPAQQTVSRNALVATVQDILGDKS